MRFGKTLVLNMRSSNTRHLNNKGQTLIIAIMVMFILSIVAAVFIGLVARNLFRSERYSNVDAVAQIAEAGIRYADEMLTTSEDGADWRPIPDSISIDRSQPYNVAENIAPTPAPDWEWLRDNHPDFKWTRAYWPTELPAGAPPGQGYAGPTGGYSTFATGGGRFLLRVSYNPNPKDALSKYIKIESIGRWGTIERDPSDPNKFDPTTLRNSGNYQLRREVTAYKPIGLTDYLRFITNKDDRPMDFALGVPGFKVDFGRSGQKSKYGARGGPIRVNGNLVWHGDFQAPGSGTPSIDIYLRGIDSSTGLGATSAPLPLDKVEVAGDIKIDRDPGTDASVQVRLNEIISTPGGSVTESSSLVKPSDDPSFTTFNGFYRDGRDAVDANNMARGVKRIEPPLVDQPDPTNTTTRYRLLTLNSGERIRRGSRWINLGQFGWGRGIYINNTRDRKEESQTLFGGYTLRSDWLNPNNPASSFWVGNYYIPLGCIITLNPGDTDGDGQPDITITRTDTADSRGRKAVWYDASGNPRPDWGSTITMPYPDPKNGRMLYASKHGSNGDKKIEGNGVIYAEGNIRIRGMLPPNMQLTVVSNETIYIEGNLLKYRDPKKLGSISDKDPYHATGPETTNCGLALLARGYVCVNTTQFFKPLNSIGADDVGSDAGDGTAPYHIIVSNEPEKQLRVQFELGPYESESGNNNVTRRLFLRHAGQFGPTYINMWLNPSAALPDFGLLYPNQLFAPLPQHVWGVGDSNFGWLGLGIGSSLVGEVFPLDDTLNAHFTTGLGIPNIFQIALDQTTYTRNNYEMGGLAIQPSDIRIEAMIYAQEGSFFIIPGPWFNRNPSDVPGGNRPPGVDPMFPYFGQPLDIRIVVDGSVTENMPAAISDVEEWMAKWGVIPQKYGSSSEDTAHPGEGLTFLYDDRVGWPVTDLANPTMPIRYDNFGRALPLAPKLPVCGSLIYSGDVM